MPIRADALCNTLVCRDPPDIESRFELALGRVVVAFGTVIMGERRWLHVLLVIDTFSYLAGFGHFAFCKFWTSLARCACQLTNTAFRSLWSFATALTTNFEHRKQF